MYILFITEEKILYANILSKSTLCDSKYLILRIFAIPKQPVIPQSAVKSCFAHVAALYDFGNRKLFLFPGVDEYSEISRGFFFRSAELYPLGFCSGNSFSLPFPDIFTFALCYKGQDLQYEVGDESSQQILTAAGVQ